MEVVGWDVKLALEYKDLQKRIISSVLTSCSAGLKMLQLEEEANDVNKAETGVVEINQ